MTEPVKETKVLTLQEVREICTKVVRKYRNSGYRRQCVVTVDDLVSAAYIRFTRTGKMNPDGGCILSASQTYSACWFLLVDLAGKYSGARRVNGGDRGKWVDAPVSITHDIHATSEQEILEKELDHQTKMNSLRRVLPHLNESIKGVVEAWLIADGVHKDAGVLLGMEEREFSKKFDSALRALRRMVGTGEYAKLA